jgi:hypothetical protein
MKAKLTFLFLLFAAPLLHAQATPGLMSYQGRVTDAAGVLIGNTTSVNRLVTFKLYSSSSGGAVLYAESQTVTISGGEFSVLIGNGTGISPNPGPSSPGTPIKTLSDIVNTGTYTSLYLGVTVDDGTAAADPEISPRQQMVSGAFSLRSKVAESVANGAVTTAMLGSGQVTKDTIAAGVVDSSRITDLSITNADIKDSTISFSKLDASIGFWAPVGTSVYRASGNVGIREPNPGFPLNFGTGNGDRISLSSNSGNSYGFGISTSLLQIHTDVVGADVAFGYGSSAAMTETMRIKGSGSVGIGTMVPTEKLTVAGGILGDKMFSNGTVRARGGNYGANSTNAGFSFDSNGDADGGLFSGSDGVLQFYTNGAERVRLNGTGNLGIGTTTLTEKVNIQGGKLWFTTATLNGDNGGIGGTMAANDFFRIFGSGDNDAGALYIDTYDAGNEPIIFRQVIGSPTAANTPYERMRIAANGYVGIGIASPLTTLHVAGGTKTSFQWEWYMYASGSQDKKDEIQTNLAHSIIAEYGIRAATFDVVSDARIKNIIGISKGADDLATLQAIEITDYSFKDQLAMGSHTQKRVIAQQVETVYPEAVTVDRGVVPDIFHQAAIAEGWVTLATDLKVGEKVRLFNGEEDAVHEVLEVRAGAFRTAFEPKGSEVFVYGREVDDFRSVDYDAIAMLNVSATQQIKREQDTEINALKSKNAELEARLSALEKRLAK